MNKLIIIGNLTRDPVTRTLQDGGIVCNVTVAVNRQQKNGESQADYFDVSAWGNLGEICERYLAKGRKAMVCGRVRARAYISQKDGSARASLEVNAESVEFLSPRQDTPDATPDGFVEVESDDLPFN